MSEDFQEVNLPPAAIAALMSPAVSGVSANGETVGVLGQSVSQPGVSGSSTSGDGVDGTSTSGVGIRGTSSSQPGVVGQSTSADGVYGEGGNNGVHGKTSNDNASGVYGINFGKGPGVSASSQYGPSLVATGYNGNLAAQFDGDAKATGNVGAATLTSTGALTAGSVTTAGDVTAFDVKLTGGDIAEEFAGGDCETMEPGTVVVFDDGGLLSPSAIPYDKRVAGVVSGGGSLRPGVILDRRPGGRDRVTVAMVGKVYCKVDARYSPIVVGDLLTTSPTPGHAMRASDQTHAFGAVVGKALERLTSGSALIPILVALQ